MDIRPTATAGATPERDLGASLARRADGSSATGNGATAAATASKATAATAATTSATATTAAGTPASDGQVKDAVAAINKSLQSAGQNIEFTVDKDSKRTVIKVIDQETQQVLRQMPTQEALDLAKALDRATGRLIQHEA